MLREEILGQGHHAVRIAGERSRVRRTGNVASDRGVLRLGRGNGNGSSHADEAEKLRRDILVHAQAAGGGREWLHPTGVESVGGLKFAPIRHGRSLELPACRFVFEIAFTNRISVDRIAVGVGPIIMVLALDPEGSGRRGRCGPPHRDRHDEKGLVALHHVGHAVAQRNLHANVGRVGGEGGGAVVRLIGAHRRSLGTPGGGRARAGAQQKTAGTGRKDKGEKRSFFEKIDHFG